MVFFIEAWRDWKPILMSKFQASPHCLETLMGTGDKYLLEFQRRPAGHWGGQLVQKENNYVVEGDNWMGRMLMLIRKEIKSN